MTSNPRIGRPRLVVDEAAILNQYASGASISSLAARHSVDRTVIRRVLRQDDTVLQFPRRDGVIIPAGHITSAELLTRADITYRQIDYWTRVGYLHPTNGDTPGSGQPRFYPVAELTVACLMRDLLDAGLTPRAAHEHARNLADHGMTVLAGIPVYLPQDL